MGCRVTSRAIRALSVSRGLCQKLRCEVTHLCRSFAASTGLKDHYDVALVDDAGVVLARKRIPDDSSGFQLLLQLLAEHGDYQDDLTPVAIETPRVCWWRVSDVPGEKSTPSIRSRSRAIANGTPLHEPSPTGWTPSCWRTS